MNSYYTMVSNQASINYSLESSGGKQSDTNIVNTLVYKPILIIYKPKTCICRTGCCFYYCNKICIYNYSINFLEDVHIRFKMPPYLKYVNGSLDIKTRAKYNADEKFIHIYIKRINPMQGIWIKFDNFSYGEPVKPLQELFRGNIKYCIISNGKRIYFKKNFYKRFGKDDDNMNRFRQPYYK